VPKPTGLAETGIFPHEIRMFSSLFCAFLDLHLKQIGAAS
jgi:hypothetical protein